MYQCLSQTSWETSQLIWSSYSCTYLLNNTKPKLGCVGTSGLRVRYTFKRSIFTTRALPQAACVTIFRIRVLRPCCFLFKEQLFKYPQHFHVFQQKANSFQRSKSPFLQLVTKSGCIQTISSNVEWSLQILTTDTYVKMIVLPLSPNYLGIGYLANTPSSHSVQGHNWN